jgi:membrane protease YdiL (CAAX protease family)
MKQFERLPSDPAVWRTADDEPTIPAPIVPIPILPEGEAIVLPPPDITPNDPGQEPPTRIPHLGHALLFLAITGFILFATQLAILVFTHPAKTAAGLPNVHPKLILLSEAFTYLLSLAACWFLFPRLWHRSFVSGLQWNGPAAIRNVFRLVPIGIVLSLTVQAASSLVQMPKSIPMDDFFRTRSDLWMVTAFGVLLAPLFEEITFRGFFLPAFAIAYDWLCLPRTEAARNTWNSSNAITLPALVFSAVLTSILFALLHGKQTAFTWPVLVLLFSVSLVLTTVRIRLRSVAASTLVHASYNLTIFVAAFIATGGYRHLERLPRQ